MPKPKRPKYLTESKNGWWSYVRRVPETLKHLPEFEKHKQFYTRALDTKDLAVAELERRKLDAWFDGLLQKNQKPKTSREALQKARDELRILGLVRPSIDPTDKNAMQDWQKDDAAHQLWWERYAADNAAAMQSWEPVTIEAEADEFVPISKPYADARGLAQEIQRLSDLLADRYDNGKGGYRRAKSTDVDWIKLKILRGDLAVEIEPTLGDAVEFYVEHYSKNSTSGKQQKRHLIQQIRSISERLARGLENGLDTPLKELDRHEIRSLAESIWPNASTRKTNLGSRMTGVINAWNKEHPKHQVTPNPFENIVSSKEAESASRKRRAAGPTEYRTFWRNLEQTADQEIKLIGMLMAYVGCPALESVGLLRGDVKLTHNVPHILYQNNRLRTLKGGRRLERVIPLVGPILDQFRSYAESFVGGKDEPFFPSYVGRKYLSSTLSKALRPCVKNIDGGEDLLSAYSLRHSFKERYQAAGVAEGVGSYFMGHRNPASSRVHESYGGIRRPEAFVGDMTKITAVEDYGYKEYFDPDT